MGNPRKTPDTRKPLTDRPSHHDVTDRDKPFTTELVQTIMDYITGDKVMNPPGPPDGDHLRLQVEFLDEHGVPARSERSLHTMAWLKLPGGYGKWGKRGAFVNKRKSCSRTMKQMGPYVPGFIATAVELLGKKDPIGETPYNLTAAALQEHLTNLLGVDGGSLYRYLVAKHKDQFPKFLSTPELDPRDNPPPRNGLVE